MELLYFLCNVIVFFNDAFQNKHILVHDRKLAFVENFITVTFSFHGHHNIYLLTYKPYVTYFVSIIQRHISFYDCELLPTRAWYFVLIFLWEEPTYLCVLRFGITITLLSYSSYQQFAFSFILVVQTLTLAL